MSKVKTEQELAVSGIKGESLYNRALLARRRELEVAYQAIEADKQTGLRQGVFNKLALMFGPWHVIEMEAETNPAGVVIGATVEDLRFLGLRVPSGEIGIHLLVRCERCGHEMAGDRLTCLADLGRELAELNRKGAIGEHECSETNPQTTT
jgi:hypothetical protein